MILNNKMFKLSSLCIMGTVAVAMSQVISSNASFGLDTITKNKDAQTGTVIEDNTGVVPQESSAYDVIINDGGVEVEETTAPTTDIPEDLSIKELIDDIADTYDEVKQASKDGDWEEFGNKMKELEDKISELDKKKNEM